MKRTPIYCLLLCLLVLPAAAQNKRTEKAPTQKEMQDMMKEAEGMMSEMMEEMSPEDKKMMDSLGMQMPNMKNVSNQLSGVSDKQLVTAWENENRLVPLKDNARIATIAKSVSDARKLTYITAIQKNLMNRMNPEAIKLCNKLYEAINLKSKNSSQSGNMAMGFWMGGKPEMALYLMGKVCIADPKELDNLSNYAAMLSMQGGQQLAIPLLNNLNAKFPRNSTLLNNLGQAWFGLGDIGKADKYLDSAIALYPYHPQANLTKGLIKESKGDKTGAIECVKRSIKHAYTKDKEEKLRQLGYKLNVKDIRIPFRPGPDPLGLSKTIRPDYPKSISELNAVYPLWKQFFADCEAEISKLEKDMQEATQAYTSSVNKMASQTMVAMSKGGTMPGITSEPIFAKKASLAMSERRAYYERKIKDMVAATKQLSDEVLAIRNTHKNAVPEAPCSAHRDAINKRLKALNERKKAYDVESLEVYRKFFNEMAFWQRYTATDENMYNMTIIPYKIEWLRKNAELRPYDMIENVGKYSDCVDEDRGKRLGKLADFDDVGCKIRDTTNLVVWQFVTTCTKLISKLDVWVLEYSRTDNFERAEGDFYDHSTIKVAAEIGKGISAGPLKAEAKVGIGLEMEMDRSGVKDVNIIAEGKFGAGTGAFDEGLEEFGSIAGNDITNTTMEVGVEAKISLISGKGSVAGSGKLSDVKITEW